MDDSVCWRITNCGSRDYNCAIVLHLGARFRILSEHFRLAGVSTRSVERFLKSSWDHASTAILPKMPSNRPLPNRFSSIWLRVKPLSLMGGKYRNLSRRVISYPIRGSKNTITKACLTSCLCCVLGVRNWPSRKPFASRPLANHPPNKHNTTAHKPHTRQKEIFSFQPNFPPNLPPFSFMSTMADEFGITIFCQCKKVVYTSVNKMTNVNYHNNI